MFRELPPLRRPSLKDYNKLFDRLQRKQSGGNSANEKPSGIPAGYTYFGQFVAHDITFNPVSDLTNRRDPESLISFRSPRLDLDSLYGRGPKDSPYFYDPAEENGRTGRLSVGWGMGRGEEDLPRTEGEPAVALIGDPRNDENTIVSQLHLAFIKLHNSFLEDREVQGDFERAQTMTCWHYQWVILNDYLHKVCDPEVLKRIWLKSKQEDSTKPDLRWFTWRFLPFIPLEFSAAAFRFGHSMVRDTYHLNFAGVPIPVFGGGSPGNLQGFRRLPSRWTVQWDLFLEFGPKPPQQSNPIDLSLAPSLEHLPSEAVGAGPADDDHDGKNLSARNVGTSLLARNIERGYQLGLPSGQAVARAIGEEKPLREIVDGCGGDPLWIYVLREGEENEGRHLGKVGSTIVAETIIGLIADDPLSYLNIEPKWKPSLDPGEDLKLSDLIRAAGMPITRNHLKSLAAFDGRFDPRVFLRDKFRTSEAQVRAERRKAGAGWSNKPEPPP
jgi:hypothetical protein